MIPLFVSKHDHLPSSRPSICHHCNIDMKPQSDQYSSCIFFVVHSSHFDAFSTKRLVKRPKHFNFMISCCVFFVSFLSLSLSHSFQKLQMICQGVSHVYLYLDINFHVHACMSKILQTTNLDIKC